VKVLQPLLVPVRSVSLAIDPMPDVPQAELDDLARAIATPLVRDGITVVPRGQEGSAELVGQVRLYRPGLRLTVIWLVLARNGSSLGQCRTDFGVSAGLDAVDWGDVMQGTGAALVEFLAAKN